MIFNSIRWRVQAWHGLILFVVLSAFGFTAYHVARDNQLRRIDQELQERLAMSFHMPPPDRGPHGGPPPEGRPGARIGPADPVFGWIPNTFAKN